MKKNLLLLILSTLLIINSKAQTLKWAKNMGGTGQNNYGYSIATDAAGNSYTAGYFAGTADFDPGAATYSLTTIGSDDIFISKLDSTGNFVWAKQIGGINIDHAVSIALDSKGNIYTTGTFQGTVDFDPGASTYTLTSAGGDDDFICKLDNSGNFLWARRVGNGNVDGAAAITVDASDNVYTTGFFRQIVDFNPDPVATNTIITQGFEDVFVLKLDPTGTFLWAKAIGGSSDDYGYAITTDASRNVYTTGTFGATVDLDPGPGTNSVTAVGGSDIFISKLDSTGAYVWGGAMGGSNIDAGNDIKVDGSGNIYTTGYFWGSGDFDPGAGTFSITPIGDKDIFVSKINSSGNLVWVKVLGGTNIDAANSINLDALGNVYTAGFFHSSAADFDPGSGTAAYTPVWGADIYFSCLDANGGYVWSKVIGGGVDDGASDFSFDASGNIYATGNFGGVVDFDPGAATTNLTSSGATDVFVMRLNQSLSVPPPAPTAIDQYSGEANKINVFPNPGSEKITISVDETATSYTVKIITVTGETVMERTNITGNNFTLDISGQANGIYFLEVIQGEKIARARFIKN